MTPVFDRYLSQQLSLSEEDLNACQNIIKSESLSFEEAVLKLKFTDEDTLMANKSAFYQVDGVQLDHYPVSQDALTLIKDNTARQHHLIPLIHTENTLQIAMSDPNDLHVIQIVEQESHLQVEAVVASLPAIKRAIEKYYGVFSVIDNLLEEVGIELEATGHFDQLSQLDEEGPVSKITRMIIEQAVSVGASDIHLEPQEDHYRIRFRIDGILQEISRFSKGYQAAITSSTKIMASMDIGEKRIPQDGRFRMKTQNRLIDIRASSFPSINGEKIVLRILDKENAHVTLDALGFNEVNLSHIKKIIQVPHGIFLVTGPTGSGKTTTLYSILEAINSTQKNIITMEDPVEYGLPSISQGQVNEKAGLTFSKGLRSILRQDPDVIMVGEIRDTETAEIAIQAALTGHLVLSTLHTNNASGAITRLIDMDLESFLVSSALEGILAQRLARRLCEDCKTLYRPPRRLMRTFDLTSEDKIYRPVGCRHCSRTGYRGRLALFELLIMTEAIRELTVEKRPTSEIQKIAMTEGLKTIRADGIHKVKQGLTTLDEIIRIAGAI